jgi:hypothetical protein
MVRRLPALAAALALLAACSGGDGGDDGASLGDTAPPTEVTAPAVPAASRPGSGSIVIGDITSEFSVTECRLEPAESDDSTLLLVTGAGTRANGVPFQIELARVANDSEVAETFTDTISYADTARILQLQRAEVAGEVTDIRDPSARGTLLRVRADGVSATGLAGPPGSGADDTEGIVGVAVDATC